MKFLMPSVAAAAIALCAGVASPAASAHAVVGVAVGFAPLPPPPRAERVVVMRPGRAWIPGFWRWNGAHHVWSAGYWAHARPGYRYVPAHWVRTGPAWRFHAGYWSR
jgi:YXWGXW repeat-containing protein